MATEQEMARAVVETLFGWHGVPSDMPAIWLLPDGRSEAQLPNFGSDLNDAHLVEAEIERRGLEHEYVTALRVPMLSRLYGPFSTADVFKLMHATAAQKLAAAYAVVQGLEKGKS